MAFIPGTSDGMRDGPSWRVDIAEQGRYGTVQYREPGGVLSFPWEFGGGETVAIITVGDVAIWRQRHPWAVAQRDAILRRVADEVIRQKAPGCRAEVDEQRGDLLIRSAARRTPAPVVGTAWYGRWRDLRVKLGLVVLIGAVIAGALAWFKNKVLVIDPGKGTPLGLSVRTDRHIATLIQTLVPYTPSLNRDHSRDQYRASIFLVPVDGSGPQLIPITGALSSNTFNLARILGGDGKTLWFDVTGIGGVDLGTFQVIGTEELRRANPSLDPAWWEDARGMEVDGRLRITTRDRMRTLEVDPVTLNASSVEVVRDVTRSPFAPTPATYLCAGAFVAPNAWLGVHSPVEVGRGFGPKSWLKRVVLAEDAKEQRRFYRGVFDPDTSDGHLRVLSMSAIGEETYLNAAFLRVDDRSEPLRLSGPDGFLMVYTSQPGLKGTLMVARVDTEGKILWKADTGIDRFNLQQILPGEGSMVFIGPRPMVPGMVSEPLLVVIDNRTGAVSVHSLWQ